MTFRRTIGRRSSSLLAVSLLLLPLASCGNDGGAPSPSGELTDLRVSGAATGLNPAFTSEVTRYSVVLAEPADPISFTVTADDAISVRVDGVPLTSGEAHSPTVQPGDTLHLTTGSPDRDERTYEIVLLPPDFPVFSVTVLEDGVSPGPLYLTAAIPGGGYAMMLDAHGVPLFYRRASQAIVDFKKHPTGERSYALRRSSDNEWDQPDFDQVVLDDEFRENRRITTVGLSQTNSHEFLLLPNGHALVLAYHVAAHDLTEFGGSTEDLLEDSVIQELDEDGTVVFEWSSWEAGLYPDRLRLEFTEYAHVNSVFVEDDGDLIVSARGTSQVLKVDRQTGAVVWRLGGKSNDFTFIDDPFANLCGQHTATRLPNGNLLLFDNGVFCWPEVPARGNTTRVVEYALDEDARTAELVWSYTDPEAFSVARGSSQRLANGNTLIGWGTSVHAVATEVDPEGRKVFEIVGQANGNPVTSYRAFRFPD